MTKETMRFVLRIWDNVSKILKLKTHTKIKNKSIVGTYIKCKLYFYFQSLVTIYFNCFSYIIAYQRRRFGLLFYGEQYLLYITNMERYTNWASYNFNVCNMLYVTCQTTTRDKVIQQCGTNKPNILFAVCVKIQKETGNIIFFVHNRHSVFIFRE